MPLTIKKPAAWVPIALSMGMLAMTMYYIVKHGVGSAPNADEGAAAHFFQLWMMAEVVLIAFFAIKWLPETPRPGFAILAIQIVAVIIAAFPVFYFGL